MLTSSRPPQHGDLWYVDFGSPGLPGGPIGHEQGLVRPAVVLTHDRWNRHYPDLYVVVPLTKRDRGSPWHVRVTPPDGNVRVPSFILCEQVSVAAWQRFGAHLGTLSPQALHEVKRRLRRLLAL